MSGLSNTYIEMKINVRRIMVFGKANDPDSIRVKQIFEEYFLPKGQHSFHTNNVQILLVQIRMDGSILKNDKIVDN